MAPKEIVTSLYYQANHYLLYTKDIHRISKIASTFIIVLLATLGFSQNTKYENLIFEGGGMKGIAYAGVISELEQSNIIAEIDKVGGTSAGAIMALMVSLGYNSNEISEIVFETNFQKFNDGRFLFLGGISRLKSKYGWYKGRSVTKWLEAIIEEKAGESEITFAELESAGFRDLYLTGMCMNKQKLIVFSADSYPEMKIKDAVRISMSIPVCFEAVFIDSKGKVYDRKYDNDNLDIMVDGGILGNFPIFMFDSLTVDSLNNEIRIPNYKTLGVRMDSDLQMKSDSLSKELVPISINNLNDYIKAFYILIHENLNRMPLIPEDWERTISVSSLGISSKIKKLTKKQKDALIQSGKIHTKNYLDKQKQYNDYAKQELTL